MTIPPSEHFTTISLLENFNVNTKALEGFFDRGDRTDENYGNRSILGIPFELGEHDGQNAILLDRAAIQVDLQGIKATYLIFVHLVEDRASCYQENLADSTVDGNELGDHVSDYVIRYVNGESHTVPILRRFAIQQATIMWGASAFAAVTAKGPDVYKSVSDEIGLGNYPASVYGPAETKNSSGRDSNGEKKLWVYALPNPNPDSPIQQLHLSPQKERSLVLGISHTQLLDHPLRPGVRQKTRLTLPEGAKLDGLGDLHGIDIDLGTVISARAALNYDANRWLGDAVDVQPEVSSTSVVVEYAAHPKAVLYVETGEDEDLCYESFDLSGQNEIQLAEVSPACRPVNIKVVEKGTGNLVAVRLHMHGEAGEYLPPKGYHRSVNPHWFEDNYGEHINGLNQYCYTLGECVADLPIGDVFVEVHKGYEIAPIRKKITVSAETDSVTLEIDHVLKWRQQGWVTADTHVHFLSPQTALLEGEGEGINVVNLLASQWGEMFSNVSDFDGRTTLGAKDFGGDGEFLVRVGTENRMQVLGHMSLLGYSGQMIQPLCTGGPSESALGDAQEVTMAEWAQRCIDQGGMVVMPHGPNPQCERAADIVLGLVHAIEMMTFNPHSWQISPYGIADWYRYLNLGYQVPIVGGSDKMAATSQLGGMRTYTHLGELEFSYDNWMNATKAGNTFVTVGPLVELKVEGQFPGSKVELPMSGGTVNVAWKVESVCLPVDQVEIIVGGLIHEQADFAKVRSASGSVEVAIQDSTWIALRVRGSYRGKPGEIAAHSSSVQVLVHGKPIYSQADATTILAQIEGAIAYLDTIAAQPDVVRLKQMRSTLEAAHNRLHQQMHRQGVYHDHKSLHNHRHAQEH